MVVSPVDQAVITRALVAAADEMGVKLIRSAHSPLSEKPKIVQLQYWTRMERWLRRRS